MKYNDTIKARKKRWNDFMSMETPVKNMYLINYTKDMPVRPPLWPDKKKERIEWIWEIYNRQMEEVEWILDDKIPFMDNLTGTEIFAEAFGCKVYRPDDNMPFALPLIHNASEVSKLKVPELSSCSLALLFEIADELQKRAGREAVMRLPDIQSPMDIAALIWDKNDFYMALVDEPEAVKELAYKVRQLLTAFLDEWFSRYGTEFIAHFPPYYMNKGITLSEDEIGAVNEKMFDEFFLPELSELSNRYGGLGMHCCANSIHQWYNFKKIPGLRLLNLVQPKDKIKKAYEIFENHVPQWHSWKGEGPAWTWVDQHPKDARVIFDIAVDNKEKAVELSEKLWEACGRQ